MGEEDIFAAALDIVDGAARARFLRDACGADEELRRRVERLLAIHDAGLSLPDRAARDPGDAGGNGGRRLEDVTDLRGDSIHVDGITLVRLVGSGGFGRVYEGWQHASRRPVAVKVLRDEMTTSDAVARLGREARLLAKLNHPGIAAVLTTGQTAEGVPCLVTEFVEGARHLNEHARLVGADLHGKVDLLRRVCAAVGHAHDRGVIHRDLKPGNILVDSSGAPKVIDFGWACALDAGVLRTTTLTGPGQIIGTWHYMSPEQFTPDGSPPTAASDVWALGLIAFELLAGRLPYDVHGKPLPAIAALMIATAPPPKLARIDPTIPEPLSRIVAKCLGRNPSARYRSAGELADDLRRFLDGEPVRARRAAFGASLLELGHRHPLGSALLGGLALGLVVAALGASRLAVVALQARDAQRRAVDDMRRARHVAEEERDMARRRLYASTLQRLSNAVGRGDSPGAQALYAEAARLAPRVDDGRDPDEPPIELRAALAVVEKSVLTFRSHRGRVVDIACSPDGSTVASVGDDGTLRIWDATRGGQLLMLAGNEGPLRRVLYAPDGRRLCSVDHQGTVRTWDASSGRPLTTLPVKARSGGCVDFSPDGSRLAIGTDDGSCRLWDLDSASPVVTLDGHGSAATAVAWSPDGRVVVTADQDRVLHLWSADDGKPIGTTRALRSSVLALGFSPDSATIAAGGRDGTLLLWSAREEGLPRVIPAHSSRILCLAFSPDGTLVATGANDQTARVFDVTTGAARGEPLPHEGPMNAIAFAGDPLELVTGDGNGSIARWSVASGRQTGTFPGHALAVTGIARLPGGRRFASASADGTIRVWDGSPDVHDAVVTSGTAAAVFVTFGRHEGEAAAAWRDGRIAVVDPMTSTTIDSLEPLGGEWNAFAASRDVDRLVAGSEQGSIRFWSRTTGRQQTIKDAHDGPIRSVAFNPDGSRFVSGGSGGEARLWDGASGALIGGLVGSRPGRSGVVVSRTGAIAAAGTTGAAVGLWAAADGQPIASFDLGAEVAAIGFSPAGDSLVAADATGAITVWDAPSRQRRAHFPTGFRPVIRLEFSGDGRLLAMLHPDPVITVWDTTTWECRGILPVPRALPGAITVSDDGSRVVTGCFDGTLRFWDPVDEAELSVAKCHAFRILGLVLSPGGRVLLSAGGDGVVRATGRTPAEAFARLVEQAAHASDRNDERLSRPAVSGVGTTPLLSP